MPNVFNKVKEALPDLPDEDITEGVELVRRNLPNANDEQVVNLLLKHAQAVKPEIINRAMAPAPNTEELFRMADERAKERYKKGKAGTTLQAIGRYISGSGRPSEVFERDLEKAKQEEYDKLKAHLRQVGADRTAATQQIGLISGAEKDAAAQQSAVAENDPNSPQSEQARQAAKVIFPNRDFSGLSAAQLKGVIGPLLRVKLEEQKSANKLEQKTATNRKKDTRYHNKFVSDQVDTFLGKNSKFLEAANEVSSVKGLIELGEWSNAALELSKTKLIRLAGDPRPSDRDLARISPNPSFIASIKRVWDKKIQNQPSKWDQQEMLAMVTLLEDRAMKQLYEKASGWANAKSDLSPTGEPIDPDEFANRLLNAQGAQNYDFTNIKRSIAESRAEGPDKTKEDKVAEKVVPDQEKLGPNEVIRIAPNGDKIVYDSVTKQPKRRVK